MAKGFYKIIDGEKVYSKKKYKKPFGKRLGGESKSGRSYRSLPANGRRLRRAL